MIKTKKCSRCKEVREVAEFHKRKDALDGLRGVCIFCYKNKMDSLDPGLKEKRRLQVKEWHANNKEYSSAKFKVYYSNNVSAISAKSCSWNKANPKRRKEIVKKYSKRHSTMILAKCNARRAKKSRQCPSWSNLKQIGIIYKEAEKLSIETSVKYHVDHIVPLTSVYVSGFHTEANLRIIVGHDNISKGNRWWPDMPDYSRVKYDPITNTLVDK